MAEDRKPLTLLGFGLVAVAGYELLKSRPGAVVGGVTRTARARFGLDTLGGAFHDWDLTHPGIPVRRPAGTEPPIAYINFGATFSAGASPVSGPTMYPGQSTSWWPVSAGGWVNQDDLAGSVTDSVPAPVVDTRPIVTAPAGLLVRSGPSTAFPIVGFIAYATPVTIACQTMGQTIGRSAVWDRLSSPATGYVSDWYVDTPVVGGFSPGYGACSGVPAPPAGSGSGVTDLAGTGSGSGGRRTQNGMREGWIVAAGCARPSTDYILAARGLALTGAVTGLEKRWIVDARTWSVLRIDRSMLHAVTPAQLASLPDGPRIFSAPAGGGRGTLPGYQVYGAPDPIDRGRGDCAS